MASDSPSTIITSAIVSGPRIASRLINACLMHVSELSGMKRKKQKDRAFLDDLGRFRLWAHGFDALPTQSDDIPEDALYQAQIPEQDGGPGSVNIQFDEVLECSEYLKEPTITLLTGFASCLLLAKLSNIGNDTTRALVQETLDDAIELYPALGNNCSDAGSDQSWKSAVGEVHDIVASLFRLAESLNEELQKLHVHMDPPLCPVIESYKHFIIDKFPNASMDLVLRFAKGNKECHERLRTLTEKTRKMKWGDEEKLCLQSQAGETLQDQVREQTSKYGLTPLGIDRHENAPVSGPDITINTPVQSDTGTPLQPSFHDSGIGSSRPSGPSGPSLVPPLSWTVHSASPSKDTHNRPSLPQIPKGRFGFTCPVCFRTQKLVITTGQWREHIFSDLQAYMCTYASCPTGTQSYQSRRDWIAHQILDHAPGDTSPASCPFCSQRFERRDRQFYTHVRHHMEDIRLFALPPSHRQRDGDYQSKGNSSATNTDGGIISSGLASVTEEQAPGTIPGVIEQYMRLNDLPDKEQSVLSWLTNKEASPDPDNDAATVHSPGIPRIFTFPPTEGDYGYSDDGVGVVGNAVTEYLSPGSIHNLSEDGYGSSDGVC